MTREMIDPWGMGARKPTDAPESEDTAKPAGVARTPPPPPMPRGVNSPAISASNTKLARQKEAEEDRALIERHQRRAFAIAMALVRDENDARELVQDAFLRVYKGLANFQGGSSFFTWLYRIITNLSIDLIRKPSHKNADLDESRLDVEEDQDAAFPFLSRVEGADPLDAVRRREIGARLQTALDALPSYHRGVIVMREVEGLSYEEMAQAMGVSKGTIMSRLFHARQKLQKALADCYAEQVGPVPADGAGPSSAPASAPPSSEAGGAA